MNRGVATAIVCPLAAELAGVLAVTTGRRVLRVPRRRGRPLTVTLGRLAGEEVALAATGDGPDAAAGGLEALAGALRPRRLLVLGVAGGLTPGLAAGTLVAARRVLAGDGSAAPRQPDERWLEQALRGGAIAGAAVSAARILADPRAKWEAFRRALPEVERAEIERAEPKRAEVKRAEVYRPELERAAAGGSTSATPWPIATVDLESAAYARVAAALALPYLVVRAVLDTAEETLPLDFEACRGRSGGVSRARVVWRTLAHPGAAAALWRLRSRVGEAAARLAALAVLLVAAPAAGAATARAGGLPRGELRAPESAMAGAGGGTPA